MLVMRMSEPTLFGELGESKKRAKEGAPRIVVPDRHQVRLEVVTSLDERLNADHPARLLEMAVSRLDLSAFYERIESRGETAGRPAIDPKMLLVLWLYATQQGIGSARELARLCREHDAYRWICGGIEVNHHTLSDFRTEHGAALDRLMTHLLGVLMHRGVLSIRRVAQDGLKVRASAGAGSFRREKSLRDCMRAARIQIARLKAIEQAADRKDPAKVRAARERAARESALRVEHALAELEEARRTESMLESEERRGNARVSTSDPQARVMKMSDGGYRPAYNVQLATETRSRLIVGVDVSNCGSDFGALEPMVQQVERRTKTRAREWLVDGGFAKKETIERLARREVKVYAPVVRSRVAVCDPYRAKETESAELGAWRRRMGSVRGRAVYRERGAVAETVNADLRTWRGLDRFLVRGREKVLAVTLLTALTYNLLRCIAAGWLNP